MYEVRVCFWRELWRRGGELGTLQKCEECREILARKAYVGVVVVMRGMHVEVWVSAEEENMALLKVMVGYLLAQKMIALSQSILKMTEMIT